MATRKFCDVCEGEIVRIQGSTIDLPGHIAEVAEGKLLGGYVDTVTNEPVSGRSDSIDLCIKCSNRVMTAAYNEMKKIHDEKGVIGSFAPFGHNGKRGAENVNRDRQKMEGSQ